MFKRLMALVCVFAIGIGILPVSAQTYEGNIEFVFYKDGYYSDGQFSSEPEKYQLAHETPLTVGERYYMSLYLSEFEKLSSMTLPVHFDSNVLEMKAFDGSTVTDGVVYDVDKLLTGELGIVLDEEFFGGVWPGVDIIMNERTPRIESQKGYFGFMFINTLEESVSSRTRILTVCFEAKQTGVIDLRAAVKSDGEGAYEPTAEEGFQFAAVRDGKNKNVTSDVQIIVNTDRIVADLPEITSTNPFAGARIGASPEIKVNYVSALPETASVKMIGYSYNNGNYTELSTAVEGSITAYQNGGTALIKPDLSEFKSGEYKFRFSINDAVGEGAYYEVIYTLDTTPPSVVNGFGAIDGVKEISLYWDEATEADVVGYKIYRSKTEDGDFEKITYVNERELQGYTDYFNADNCGTYYYYITAVDESGNESKPSLIANATASAYGIPEVMWIKPDSGKTISGNTQVEAYARCEGTSIEKMTLYYSADKKDWKLYEEKTLTAYDGGQCKFDFDTTAFADGEIHIKVVASVNGIESEEDITRTYLIDNTAPDKVTGLKQQSSEQTYVTITWDRSANEDISHYIIERKDGDTFTECATVSVTSKTITGLSPDSSYVYRVIAVDNAGNRSEPSEPLTATTATDTAGPVITNITPSSKRVSGTEQFTIYFTATDETGVYAYKFQTSADGEKWTDISEYISFDPSEQSVTFNFNFNAQSYAEGNIYIRAIAKDVRGNESSTGIDAPYVLYCVDRTAPTAPVIIKSAGYEGYAEIEWNAAESDVVSSYRVYRSTAVDGEYVLIDSNRTYLNYFDKNLSAGTYYYKVEAVDDVGNISPKSNAAQVTVKADETAPVVTLGAASGTYLKNKSKISVYANDGGKLKTIKLEYKSSNGQWASIGEKTITGTSFKADFEIDLPDGEYEFRGYAEDEAGNSAYSDSVKYIIDSVAPVITNEAITASEDGLNLSWSNNDADIDAFEIYYKETYDGYTSEYKGYERFSVNGPEKTDYTKLLSLKKYNRTYTVKIIAFDKAGNSSYKEVSVLQNKTTAAPRAIITAPSAMTIGVEEYFDASRSTDDIGIDSYLWDFGDGTTSTEMKKAHRYDELGTYTVTLTVTNAAGKSTTVSKVVTVKERVATAKIKVVDDTGNSIPNAYIAFNFGDESQSESVTRADGTADLTGDPGSYTVVVYAGSNYLPQKRTVKLDYNSSKPVQIIRLIKQDIVIGKLTYERVNNEEELREHFTEEELSKPENNVILKYKVEITIGEKVVSTEGYKPATDNGPITITHKSERPSDWGFPGDPGDNMDITIQVYDFNDITDGYDYEAGGTTARPRNIVAVLGIPGEASWLKEFFDVNLTVSNQADESFVLNDCSVNLNIPGSGLTLMETSSEGYENSLRVDIGKIPGQTDSSISWILRGDKAGEYDISADFYGKLYAIENGVEYPVINEPIETTFKCDKPIVVYGNEGLSLIVEGEREFTETDTYMLRVGIENRGRIKRLKPSVTLKADGNIVKPVDGYINYLELENGMRYAGDDELAPGETLFSNYTIDWDSFVETIRDMGYDIGNSARIDTKVMRIAAEYLLGTDTEIPVKTSIVDTLDFHENSIQVFRVNDDGTMSKADHISAYSGEKLNLAALVTGTIPGEAENIPLSGMPVWIKESGTLKMLDKVTDENGWIYFDYTCPVNEQSCVLSIKSDRTRMYKSNIQFKSGLARMTGTVYDKRGNLIEGAVITVEGKNCTTNSNGTYTIDDIEIGEKNISIQKDGYQPFETEVNLENGINICDFEIFKDAIRIEYLGGDISKSAIVENDIIEVPVGFDRLDIDVNFVVKAKNESNSDISEYCALVNGTEVYSGDKLCINSSYMTDGAVFDVYVKTEDGEQSEMHTFTIKHIETPFNLAEIANLDAAIEQNRNVFTLAKGVLKSRIKLKDLFTGDVSEKWGKAFNDNYVSALSDMNWEFEVKNPDISPLLENISFSMETDWKKFGVPIEVSYDMSSYMLKAKSLGSVSDSIGTLKFVEHTTSSSLGVRSTSWMSMKAVPQVIYSYKRGLWNIDSSLSVSTRSGWGYGVYSISLMNWLSVFIECSAGIEMDNNIRSYILDAANEPEVIIEPEEAGIDFRVSGKKGNGVFNMHRFLTTDNPMLMSHYLYADIDARMQYIPNLEMSGSYNWGYGMSYLGWEMNMTRKKGNFTYPEVSLFSIGEEQNEGYKAIEPSQLSWKNDGAVSLMSAESSQNIGEEIASGISRNTANKVVADGAGNDILLFTTDVGTGDPERTAGNTSILKYSVRNGNSWSTPLNVAADETADYAPEAATVGDNIVAVWVNMKSSIDTNAGSEYSISELEEATASQMAVSAAVYKDGQWSGTRQISSDDYANYAPVIAAVGTDKAVAAWIANADKNITGEDRTDSVMYSYYDGKSWSTPQIILDKWGRINEIDIRENNGTVYLIMNAHTTNVIDDESSKTEIEHNKMYMIRGVVGESAISWSDIPKYLLNNECDDDFGGFIMNNGKLNVAISNNGMLYMVDTVNRNITAEFENTVSSTATEMTVAQNGNDIVFAWVASPEGEQKIYTNSYNTETGVFTDAVPIAEAADGEISKNITAVYSDIPRIVYNKYLFDTSSESGEAISDVVLCSHNVDSSAVNVHVTALEHDDTAPAAGQTVNFTATVKNDGMYAAECSVVLKRNDTGSEIANSNISLESAEEKTITIPWVVENVTENFTVEAYIKNGETVISESVFCDMIAEDARVELEYNPTLNRIVATVQNVGYAALPDAKLTVVNNADDTKLVYNGAELDGYDIGSIAKSGQNQISIPLDGVAFDNGRLNVSASVELSQAVGFAADTTQLGTAELDYDNNNATLVSPYIAIDRDVLSGSMKIGRFYAVDNMSGISERKLEGVSVKLIAEDKTEYTAVTGDDGTFAFGGVLADGTYTLTLSKYGYLTRTITGVVVEEGKDKDNKLQDIVFIEGDISGDGMINTIDVTYAIGMLREYTGEKPEHLRQVPDYINTKEDIKIIAGNGSWSTITYQRMLMPGMETYASNISE